MTGAPLLYIVYETESRSFKLPTKMIKINYKTFYAKLTECYCLKLANCGHLV